MIYDDVFLVHKQVYSIIPFLPISIDADRKWIYIVKRFGMALCSEKYVQRIINLPIKVIISECVRF